MVSIGGVLAFVAVSPAPTMGQQKKRTLHTRTRNAAAVVARAGHCYHMTR